MIKSMLVGMLLVAGLGSGIASAQERTVSVWGYQFSAPNAQASQPGLVALAPQATQDAVQVGQQTRHLRHTR